LEALLRLLRFRIGFSLPSASATDVGLHQVCEHDLNASHQIRQHTTWRRMTRREIKSRDEPVCGQWARCFQCTSVKSNYRTYSALIYVYRQGSLTCSLSTPDPTQWQKGKNSYRGCKTRGSSGFLMDAVGKLKSGALSANSSSLRTSSFIPTSFKLLYSIA
jgi:hypothetical protein